jgi:predicted transcriptional regulator
MKLIDPTTGQTYNTIGIARKKPFPEGMEFHFLFKDLTRYLLSRDLQLTGADHRVMFALINHVGWENRIDVTLDTLCEELGMKKPHVSTSIKKLVNADIVEKIPGETDPRRWHYRFNPHFLWKGSVKSWEETMNTKMNVTSLSGKKKQKLEPIS